MKFFLKTQLNQINPSASFININDYKDISMDILLLIEGGATLLGGAVAQR